MWSRKPDAGGAGARAGAVEAQRERDARLLGLARDVGRSRSRSGILPYLHRRRVALEALGPRDRRAGARQSVRGGADPDLAHAPAEVARAQPRGEARGPAGGQRVVRAGHVVAEGGARSRRPTKTQPALRTRGASSSALGADRARGARARRPRRSPAPPRGRGRPPARAAAWPRGRRRSRRAAPASSLTAQTMVPSPCSAWAARSIATSAGSAPSRGQHEHVGRSREAVDARRRR